jgi:hypothetical protein
VASSKLQALLINIKAIALLNIVCTHQFLQRIKMTIDGGWVERLCTFRMEVMHLGCRHCVLVSKEKSLDPDL